jgi:uncharacterized membrane protein
VLASIGSTPYKIVFLLHILSVIVAFAPAFVWPVTNASLRKEGGVGSRVATQVVRNSMLVHGPALVLTGFFGILLIVLSDEVWEFSQMWVSMAFLVWFALLGVVFGAIIPAERKVAGGDEAAEKKVAMFGGISHVLLLVMLILMIWKPGL